MSKSFVLEICIDGIESAINAIDGGAQRLEVCLALKDDGLTPSNGLVLAITDYLKQNTLLDKVQLYAMIRPRGGDFVYSNNEVQQMIKEINELKGLVSGYVFGCLKEDGTLDLATNALLINECKEYENTFHRALDKCLDPFKALEQIIELGFKRVITSGQGLNAFKGIEVIKKLIQLNQGRIKISPASGIDATNLDQLIQQLDCQTNEFHCSAKTLQQTKMQTDKERLFNYYVSDKKIVSSMIKIGEKYSFI